MKHQNRERGRDIERPAPFRPRTRRPSRYACSYERLRSMRLAYLSPAAWMIRTSTTSTAMHAIMIPAL